MNNRLKFLEKLPVWAQRENIEDAIRKNDVVILEGEAGSGKSTVVPYLLYQMGYSIVVTQPRRLPAEALARYMAPIVGGELGETVGYWHGLSKAMSQKTEILFCTDGLEVIMQITRELEGKERNYVLVLDEIHEWNRNQEILAAILKAAFRNDQKMKLVILSATMQARELNDFFADVSKTVLLSVPGRLYPVEFHEIEKEVKDSSGMMVDATTHTATKLALMGRNVLMFYPGKKEIYDAIEKLNDSVDAVILPLHSELTSEEQQKCFERYDKPKIIVATNIAQTSVTVPDIDAVVDSGLERRKEVHDGIEGLYLRPISQSDCLQRKGRAGRTHEGEYYLCADIAFKYRHEFGVPEIQRSLLDQLVLRLLSIGKDPETLEFFHQPDKKLIVLAKESLERMGATKDGKVTQLGKELSTIPIETRYGRMILKANELGVVDDVITLAAILQFGSLLDYKTGRYSLFSDEQESGLLAELDTWNKVCELEWDELTKYPINRKILFRVKEFRKKLFDSLRGKVEFGSNGDRKKIVEACLYGMLGEIFVCGYRGYYSANGTRFNLDRNGVMTYSKFVFGIPRTIEYINKRWGNKETMNIISMASAVEMEKVKELVPQYFKRVEESVVYYPEHESCIVKEEITYGGYAVSSEVKEVYNHLCHEACKQAFYNAHLSFYEKLKLEDYIERLNKQERQYSLTVAGKTYKVEYDDCSWNPNKKSDPYIVIDYKELYEAPLKDEDAIYLDDGTPVIIDCGYEQSTDLDYLRIQVDMIRMKNAWRDAEALLLKKKSSKRNVVLGWKDCIGKKKIYKTMDGITVIGFQHLVFENGTYQVKLFETDNPEATKEALQRLFVSEFDKVLTEKRFMIIGHEGKKVLTKKGVAALSELKDYVYLYASDVTFDNFESSVNEIMEIYEEKLAEVQAG